MGEDARELEFGTGGLRGLMGEGPGRMNLNTVVRATKGLVRWLDGARGEGVAVAFDTRHHSREFARAAASTLAASGVRALLFDRPAPTPLAAYAVRRLGLGAGVVITASHNPREYNGYKVYGPDGAQIGEVAAREIARHMAAAILPDEVPAAAEAQARARGLIAGVPEEIAEEFLSCARALYDAGADLPPVKVVYTPLHGAGREWVRRALQSLPGVSMEEVASQCEPDGDFPSCPLPNPELPASFDAAISLARQIGADIALATDPDCDRTAAAVKTRSGGWRVLTGNEAGVLLLDDRLERWQGARPPVVIKTKVSTDQALKIAEAHGAQMVEVPTGFKHIGARLHEMEARGALGQFAFAFEESCGYLADPRVRDKDGVQASVMLCALARRLKGAGQTFDEALEALKRRYGYTLDKLRTFPALDARELFESLRHHPPEILCGMEIAAQDESEGLCLTGLGIKAIVRASGTEPKLKAYLSASSASEREARLRLRTLAGDVTRWIDRVPKA
jgi:phosphoglucomutase